MVFSTKIYKLLQKVDSSLRDVLIGILEELEEQRKQWEESVTKSEFREFVKATEENFRKVWQVLHELSQAQRRTEERLEQLAQRVDQLAEAQRRTEERLEQLAQRVDQLAEAQRRTEERLEQLAEAQRRTEERLEQLAQRVDQLAEAQRRTEERLGWLIEEHRKTREMLGGLSHTVGYVLEDRAYVGLKQILPSRYGIELKEPLRRDYVKVNGDYEEVNIIGRGEAKGKQVWIIGEGKTQLKKKDIDNFLNKVERLSSALEGDKFYVIVCYQASPQVRKYAQERGIQIIFSWELPL